MATLGSLRGCSSMVEHQLPKLRMRVRFSSSAPLQRTRILSEAVTLMLRYRERMSARTGAERYLENRREDPDYDRAYTSARRRIDQVDALIRELDERRCSLNLSKAELARRADLRPEVIRRLFTAASPNPTLATVVALAGALELELTTESVEDSRAS